MHTHSSIRSREIVLLCEILHPLLSQIHREQCLRIFRLETLDDAVQTSADFIVKFRGRLRCCLKLARQLLKRFFLGRVATILIDHSIAEQPVEPRNRRLVLLKVPLVLKRAKVAGLKYIFSQSRIRHTTSHEVKKELSLTKKFV